MCAAINKSGRDSRSGGFTLIELLIVVVIVGILAAIGTPSYREFVAQQRIKTASFDLMSSLTLTRSEALKRNTTVDMAPASGSWVNGWSIAVGGTTLGQQASIPGLSVVCRSGSSIVTPCPTISYNNNGRLSGTTAPSIELGSTAGGSSIRCVSIDLSGRPHSTKASCS